MKNEAEAYGHHKAESRMNDKGNGQHHPDEASVVHDKHSADTLSTILSDDKTLEIPSLQQEEEDHGH